MDNVEIVNVENYKFFGMIIDEDLIYEVYVDEFCNKFLKWFGFLCYISFYLKKN